MNYLLDADSVIDYFTSQRAVQARFSQFLTAGAALSTPTLIELWTGVYGGRDPRHATRQLRAFLQSVKVHRVNRRAIDRAARLRAQLLATRAPIRHRAYDLLTAATALAYDLTLATSATLPTSPTSSGSIRAPARPGSRR